MNRWVSDASRGDWHLISYHPYEEGDDESVTIVTYCGRVLPVDAPQKEWTEIDGRFEAVHDECYRKSEAL